VRRLAALTMLTFYTGQYALRPWRALTMLGRTVRAAEHVVPADAQREIRRVVTRRFVPAALARRLTCTRIPAPR
jgi:hypothetical protein